MIAFGAPSSGVGESDVIAPPGRLETPELMDRFREVVRVARDPLGPIGTDKIFAAIDKAVLDAVKVGR